VLGAIYARLAKGRIVMPQHTVGNSNRTLIGVVFLLLATTLGGCDATPPSDQAFVQERREISEEFSRKKLCSEYGRAELAQLQKENSSAFLVDASSVWCYNQEFNTCISISTNRAFIVPLQGKARQFGEDQWKIKDLLTNVDIASLSGKELENPALTEQLLATKERLCPQLAVK
jgi:hypothetical protein